MKIPLWVIHQPANASWHMPWGKTVVAKSHPKWFLLLRPRALFRVLCSANPGGSFRSSQGSDHPRGPFNLFCPSPTLGPPCKISGAQVIEPLRYTVVPLARALLLQPHLVWKQASPWFIRMSRTIRTRWMRARHCGWSLCVGSASPCSCFSPPCSVV